MNHIICLEQERDPETRSRKQYYCAEKRTMNYCTSKLGTEREVKYWPEAELRWSPQKLTLLLSLPEDKPHTGTGIVQFRTHVTLGAPQWWHLIIHIAVCQTRYFIDAFIITVENAVCASQDCACNGIQCCICDSLVCFYSTDGWKTKLHKCYKRFNSFVEASCRHIHFIIRWKISRMF